MDDSGAMQSTPVKAPRWPKGLGAFGILVAVLMFFDHLGDLGPLSWSRQDWIRHVPELAERPELVDLVMQAMNPAWIVPVSLLGMALAGLLLAGSVNLRQQRHRGVVQCRVWSWLAIAFMVFEGGRRLFWLTGHFEEVWAIESSGNPWWEYIVVAVVLALLAYPVFLLVYLSRPSIRNQYAGWPA